MFARLRLVPVAFVCVQYAMIFDLAPKMPDFALRIPTDGCGQALGGLVSRGDAGIDLQVIDQGSQMLLDFFPGRRGIPVNRLPDLACAGRFDPPVAFCF